jgi:5'-methylthioinosine phosphorylase
MHRAVGLILGSGARWIELESGREQSVTTPYGPPSGPVIEAACAGKPVMLVHRHGRDHTIAPHEVNYRANIWALRDCGVGSIIAINAVGAIAPGFGPGDLAVPDQIIDYTWGRESTFGDLGDGIPHTEFTEPLDPELRGALATAAAAGGLGIRSGTYGVTQGPRLETAAEIDRLERDGCDMVGMTAMPEALLAREVGIGYAVLAVAVNYAAGRSPSGRSIHAELETSIEIGMRRVSTVLGNVLGSLRGPGL